MAPNNRKSALPKEVENCQNPSLVSDSAQFLVSEITNDCLSQQSDHPPTPISPTGGDFSCQNTMQTLNLTLLQRRLLTRMKRVGHTTIAGFTSCFEDYGTEETEAALRDLQTNGLVIERTWRKWQLTGDGLQHARGLRDEQLQYQGQ